MVAFGLYLPYRVGSSYAPVLGKEEIGSICK
jgi:hypothetical protein